MAPRTRQSQKAARTHAEEDSHVLLEHSTSPNIVPVNNVDVAGQSAINQTAPQTGLTSKGKGKGKRTSSPHKNSPGSHTDPVVQPTPTKKARKVGPSDSRPMQLRLTSEGEMARQQSSDGAGGTSVGRQQRMSSFHSALSFYPGPAGRRGVASVPNLETDQLTEPNTDNSLTEDEEDWIGEQGMPIPSQGQRTKFFEATANERPSWQGPVAMTRPLTTERSPRASNSQGCDINVTPGHGATAPTLLLATESVPLTAKAAVNMAVPLTAHPLQEGVSPTLWPADTELQVIAGTTRIILTTQSALIQSVIHGSFEHVQASLLFEHAFPGPLLALSFIRNALVTSAKKCGPAAASIHTRLLNDEDYVKRIAPLPRARISLFRGDLKNYCSSLTSPVFMSMLASMSSRSEIARYSREQTSGYRYTFPTRTAPKSVGNNLVMRSKPYRNELIIKIIRDRFFGGGTSSIATRFKHLFPSYEGPDGVRVNEIPIPMVALVATGIYAALHEWDTGEQQVIEFSTNAYLDAYYGHIDTFDLIKDERVAAFHTMMTEIYSRASIITDIGVPSGVPVAQLNLDELE